MSSAKLFVLGRKEDQFKAEAGLTNKANGASSSPPPDNGKPNGKGTNLKPAFVHQHVPRISAQSQFVARR